MQACTYTHMDTKNMYDAYMCIHVIACMYIDNTFVSLHLVATNSDANVLWITVKRNNTIDTRENVGEK